MVKRRKPEPLRHIAGDGDRSSPMTRSETPTLSVGAVLGVARSERGESIDEVAAALRIRSGFLEAIESNRFGDLPGATYAIGFVRSYAEYLGLDADDAVRRFKDQAVGLDRRPKLVFPVPAPSDGRFPGAAVLIISLVIGAVAYGAWFYSGAELPPVAGLVPDPPQESDAPADSAPPTPWFNAVNDQADAAGPSATSRAADDGSGEAPGTAAGGADTPPEAGDAAALAGAEPAVPAADEDASEPAAEPSRIEDDGTAEAPDPSGETPPGEPSVRQLGAAERDSTGASDDSSEAAEALALSIAEAAEEVSVAAVEPAAGPDQAAGEGPSPPMRAARVEGSASAAQAAAIASGRQIMIRATYDSWVQVRDSRNEPMFGRVLRAGDVYAVPNVAGLLLDTGNAGALEIEVDGRPLPPLGAFGEIRRDIALDTLALGHGASR
jgi:cytoskeleton protein RodZ